MKPYIMAYIASLLIFLVIDAIWLAFIAKKFYAEQLGHLMRSDILFFPAAIFYLVYSIGIVVLAVRPDQPTLPYTQIAIYGALVGLVGYGAYGFTNIATLKDWPIKMSVIDLTWGISISALMAVSGAFAARTFGQ